MGEALLVILMNSLILKNVVANAITAAGPWAGSGSLSIAMRKILTMIFCSIILLLVVQILFY